MSFKFSKGKGAAPAKTVVPRVVHEEEEEEEEEHEEQEDQQNGGGDEDGDDGDEQHNDDNENETDSSGGGKKSKSSESHAKSKQTLLDRKSKRPNYELMEQAKRLWEDVRSDSTSDDKRKDKIATLMGLVKGKVMELIFKHDASRIVQTLLKVGSQGVRQNIAEEMKGHYVALAKSAYARNTVLKVLLYLPAMRKAVIREFYGHVIPMLRHKEASLVIEEIFLEYAKQNERLSLLEEFYGPEFSLFKTTENSEPKTLGEIKQSHPEKMPAILKNLQQTIQDMINKGTVRFNIAHHAIMEFMTHAPVAQVQDFVVDIQDHLAEILHTQRGSRVAMLALAHGNAKNRKQIVKSFKDLVAKIAQEEHGHMVLLRLFDVVDDTVLVEKSILNEVKKNLSTLVKHKYGRKCVLYILAGRSKSYFDPATLQLLSSGDEIRASTSKKDPADRSAELLNYLSPALVELVTNEAAPLVRDQFGAHVVLETLTHAAGKEAAQQALVQALVQCKDVKDDAEANLFENIVANRIVKRLINIDTELLAAGKPSSGFTALLQAELKGSWGELALTWASVVVLALLENPEVQAAVKKELDPLITKGTLEKSTIAAALLLAKKMRELRKEPVPEAVSQKLKSTERPVSGQKRAADADAKPSKKSKPTPQKQTTTPLKIVPLQQKSTTPTSGSKRPHSQVGEEEQQQAEKPVTPVAKRPNFVPPPSSTPTKAAQESTPAKSPAKPSTPVAAAAAAAAAPVTPAPSKTPRTLVSRRTPPVTRSTKKPAGKATLQ